MVKKRSLLTNPLRPTQTRVHQGNGPHTIMSRLAPARGNLRSLALTLHFPNERIRSRKIK